MQSDIAVQPGETSVTAALRQLAAAEGWCVAHTTDGQHEPGSLHYSGRAVDLAGRSGPGIDTLEMAVIAARVLEVVPLPLISELIWAGPGPRYVKNGVLLDGQDGRPTGAAVYDADTRAAHHNHVHLAVVDGFTFTASEAHMPSPSAVSVAAAFQYEGGYVIVLTTGAVYAFNCTYRGALDIQGTTVTYVPPT